MARSGRALAAVTTATMAAMVACSPAAAVHPGDGGAHTADGGVHSVDSGARDATRPARDAGSSDADASDGGPCRVGGDGGYVDTPFQKLSMYCLVSIVDGGITLAPGVVPYDVNTPLFSNYAVKVRGVWVPPGQHAIYSDGGPMTFPPGTILTKSFGLPVAVERGATVVRWIETRLVLSTASGYTAFTYVWDPDGKDATLSYAGEQPDASWIGFDGGELDSTYLVPNTGECKYCHLAGDASVVPIGPNARQLNKIYEYPDGGENQLAHWTRVGILEGAPDAAAAPRLPMWDDPTTGSVAQRARAYLEANCANCHDALGQAGPSGLYLLATEDASTTYGICKPPVAAGGATGGDSYDIVPGQPDASLMVRRMASTIPQVMMPQIDRTVVDKGGLALITEWIASLDGGCQAP